MHLRLCLAAVLPTTLALTVPRIETQSPSDRHLVPRVGGKPAPAVEPEHGPVAPIEQPGLQGHGDNVPMGATLFSSDELWHQVPDYPLTFDTYVDSNSPVEEDTTALTKPVAGTSSLHIGSRDAHVGATIRTFGDRFQGLANLVLRSTDSRQPSAGDTRRNKAWQYMQGKLITQGPAPKAETTVGSNVPPGQKIQVAQVLAHHDDPEFRLGIDIDKLPRVELFDEPYDEYAPKYETVDREYHYGTWRKEALKGGKTWEVWHPGRRSLASPTIRSRASKRQSSITTIKSAESQAASGQKNNTEDFTAQFQIYVNTYDAVQANITELIVPFLSSFVQSTNDSMMIDIAWSIYSQLTGSNVFVSGPFMYGMHCLDSLEEQYLKTNNISSNATKFDDATMQYLAYHKLLLDTYTSTWSNATAVVNQTGQLSEMARLTRFLMPTDSSITPDGWYTNATASYDDTFFKTFGLTQIHNTASSKQRRRSRS